MPNTLRHLIGAAALTLVIPLAAVAAQGAADPAMGTWVLNVAKSKYEPGPPAKSQTRTLSGSGTSYKFVADGVDAKGTKTHTEFTAAFDGKYHAVTGNPTADSIMVKRIDANTVESVMKKGAKEVVRNMRTVSKDGKTMTVVAKGTGPDGKPYTNSEVFEKK